MQRSLNLYIMKKNINKIDKYLSSGVITFLLRGFLLLYFALIVNYQIVRLSVDDSHYIDDDSNVEYEYGLVLGTTPSIRGKEYPFFWHRIDAAVKLYENGNVKKLIVSGRVGERGYHEPLAMKKALLKRGIPEDCIVMDKHGDRTIYSIYRAKHVFKLNRFIIISQKFHNERALTIAKHYDLNCVAFNAENDSFIPLGRVVIREHLARVKMYFDFILKTKVPEQNDSFLHN